VLQTQDLKASQKKKSCIRINIRELNKVPIIGLSILYMLDYILYNVIFVPGPSMMFYVTCD